MKFGVCYFPEHWPEARWHEDVKAMRSIGVSTVRVGEFAWSALEPRRGEFSFDWLDRALEVLADGGLEVILCTPTATPPKWLIDERPDILAFDRGGRPRRFGSRRHYCFSSKAYREETARIVTLLAERYGDREEVVGWQVDNEYGCHDTVRSYSPSAAAAFRDWLAARYQTAEALNQAWGTAFWSQTYGVFSEVDLPNLTVTEPNPAHVLDFYRFSSDQVMSYHRLQADILREHSPGRDIYHNAMGHFTDFDHFALGAEVDVLGWDSYPCGFLDQEPYAPEDKVRYMRQGHPDFAAFHHDLYRACSGRWAVLEQQPGPVNWAKHNPAPAPGMVRLWLHEAAAHGAELGCVFRWRQFLQAQEQFHAGLLRVDGEPAPGFEEVRQCAQEQAELAPDACEPAPVALMFDYETQWMSEIQPQGDWNYFMIALQWYGAARSFGHNIDIVKPGQDLGAYKVVLVPSLFAVSPAAFGALKLTGAQLVFGPRSGSKTEHFGIPPDLAPGALTDLIPLRVTLSESVPSHYQYEGEYGERKVAAAHWLDHVETELEPITCDASGRGLLYAHGAAHYFSSLPKRGFLQAVLADVFERVGVASVSLPDSVRQRRTRERVYQFNYAADSVTQAAPERASTDERPIAPCGVRIDDAVAHKTEFAG